MNSYCDNFVFNKLYHVHDTLPSIRKKKAFTVCSDEDELMGVDGVLQKILTRIQI